MGFDMGLGMLMMLVGFLVFLAAIGAAVYLGTRAASRPDGGELEQGDSPRALLDRRLASGEISTEEYYERESALRDAQPVTGRR
jgi:uncharacterized membrane protein